MRPLQHNWEDAHVQTLVSMWGKVPTVEIAEKIGCGITKNSVVGKAARLGLTRLAFRSKHSYLVRKPSSPCARGHTAGRRKNGTCIECAKEQKRRAYYGEPKMPRANTSRTYFRPVPPQKVKFMDSPEPDFLKLITITELNGFTCHWPVGDPSNLDEFRYCGLPKNPWDKSPYCSHHLQKSMKSFEAVFACR